MKTTLKDPDGPLCNTENNSGHTCPACSVVGGGHLLGRAEPLGTLMALLRQSYKWMSIVQKLSFSFTNADIQIANTMN